MEIERVFVFVLFDFFMCGHCVVIKRLSMKEKNHILIKKKNLK